MNQDLNQDVKLNEFIIYLIADRKILIFLISFALLIVFLLNYFLSNYEFEKKYVYKIKINPYNFNDVAGIYQDNIFGGEILAILQDESLIEIQTNFQGPLLPFNENSKSLTYSYYKMFSDILQSSKVKNQVIKYLINDKKIDTQFTSSLNFSFDLLQSLPAETSRIYNDYIEMTVSSVDNNTSKEAIIEAINNSYSILFEKLNSEIMIINAPKKDLINFMIESFKNDLKIYQKYYTEELKYINNTKAKIDRLIFLSSSINLINIDYKETINKKNFDDDLSFKVENNTLQISLTNFIIYSLIASFILYFVIVYIRALLKRKNILI